MRSRGRKNSQILYLAGVRTSITCCLGIFNLNHVLNSRCGLIQTPMPSGVPILPVLLIKSEVLLKCSDCIGLRFIVFVSCMHFCSCTFKHFQPSRKELIHRFVCPTMCALILETRQGLTEILISYWLYPQHNCKWKWNLFYLLFSLRQSRVFHYFTEKHFDHQYDLTDAW